MFVLREVIGQGRGIMLWRNRCAKGQTVRNTFCSSARGCKGWKNKWKFCGGEMSIGGGVIVQPTTANPHFLLFYPKNWWAQPRVAHSGEAGAMPGEWWLSLCRYRKILKCLEEEEGWKVMENTTSMIYPQDGLEMGFEYESVINSSIIDSWAHHLHN